MTARALADDPQFSHDAISRCNWPVATAERVPQILQTKPGAGDPWSGAMRRNQSEPKTGCDGIGVKHPDGIER